MHKVMLVLDSEDLSAILHKELSANFDVKICDAANAADMIDHYRPDTLILDLFLPGTNGFQILQSSNYRIPSIILLTVLLSTDIMHRSSKLSVDYIFRKPFKLSALKNRLNGLHSTAIK